MTAMHTTLCSARSLHAPTITCAARRPIKLLFLATNPDERVHLHVEREHREIKQALRLSHYWESIAMASEWAVRVDDLQRLLLDHRPDIVHISGHGEAPGKQVMAGRGGGLKPFPARAAAELFHALAPAPRLVVFSACFSREHADAAAPHVGCAIGTDGLLMDEAAIAFAAALYRAIGFGCTVRSAVELGVSELRMQGLATGSEPALVSAGVDPDALVLVGKVAADAVGPGPEISALVNMPECVPELFGREAELEALEAAFQARASDTGSGATCVRVAIEGLAGVGKSALAAHLAYRLGQRGAFPGGVYWLDAEMRDLRAAWAHAIADALGLPDAPSAERATLAVRALSRLDAPLLLVLDNADSWSEQPFPLPVGPHVNVLVTTRRHRFGGTRFHHHELSTLHPPFDRQLLRSIAGARIGNCDELLHYLGGHALAIEVAAAYLTEFSGETAASYLAQLRDHPGDAEQRLAELGDCEPALQRGFRMLWDRLDQATRHAWLLAACFEPEFTGSGLADEVGLDERARRKLRQFHLVDVDSHGRWRMHRLCKAFGAHVATANEWRAARMLFVRGCERYTRAVRTAAGFRVYLCERANVDLALTMAEALFRAGEHTVASLQGNVAVALHTMGEPTRARSLMERAVANATAAADCAHPMVTRLRVNLAMILSDLGQLDRAQALVEGALAIDTDRFGEHHPIVAEHRSDLAMVLKRRGEPARARDYLVLALHADLRNWGEGHPVVADRRANLAMVVKDLGELSRARELLELALQADVQVFGDSHPHVAARRASLAAVLSDMGRYEPAQRLLEQALDTAIEWLGLDHPTTATHQCNLAMVLKQRGRFDKARGLLECALKTDISLYGEHHRSVAATRSNLAMVLDALGDSSDARELLEQVLASELRAVGEHHPRVAACRSNLAMVVKKTGELPRAKQLLEQALASDRRHLADDHPAMATRRANLAMVLKQLGPLEPARALLQTALDAGVRVLGNDHPTVATRRANLAMILRDLGEHRRAVKLLEEALAVDIQQLGDRHPHVAMSRSNLAMVLKEQGRLDAAYELLKRALAPLLHGHTATQPLVTVIQRNLAQVRREISDASTLNGST